jgi:transcriptional regulator with XRE-family HTH domain
MNLVELIKKITEENNITAYEIAKNTSVSINTVRNVLNGSEVKTKQKTLLIIVEYLENAIVGTKGSIEVKKEYTTEYRNRNAAEEPAEYTTDFNNLKIDDKLNIIYKQQRNKQILYIFVH